MRVWSKSEPIFRALTVACCKYLSGAENTLQLIDGLARSIGQTHTDDVLLMSNEDLLGLLPSRGLQDTLYGKSILYLPIIQSAIKDAGHEVQFVFYVRKYNDWLHSLYRYTFKNDPNRPFAPKQYKAKRNLPDDWNDLKATLTSALGADSITFINYETDRANGRLGTALFKMCDMTDEQIDALNWIAPVNVSRPETVDPTKW
jgi:hypothetical protein